MKLRKILKQNELTTWVDLEILTGEKILRFMPMSAECILKDKDLKEYLNCNILKYQLTYTKTTDKNKLRLYVLAKGGKE